MQSSHENKLSSLCKTCNKTPKVDSIYCQECLDQASEDGLLEIVEGRESIKGIWHRPDSLHEAVSRIDEHLMAHILKASAIALWNSEVKQELIEKYGFPDFVVQALPDVISDTYQCYGEQLKVYSVDDL